MNDDFDTITLGSRVFMRQADSIWSTGSWLLFERRGREWQAAYLLSLSGWRATPDEAYLDLLATMASDHEWQARELREEADRV